VLNRCNSIHNLKLRSIKGKQLGRKEQAQEMDEILTFFEFRADKGCASVALGKVEAFFVERFSSRSPSSR